MSKFCEFCGKPTNNGICTCEEYQKQIGYQIPPQTNSQFAAASKEQFAKSKNLFMQFVKNPIGMMSQIVSIEDNKSPFIFGVIHALIVFLYVYLKTSIPQLSAIVACTIFAISFITAGITFGFAKKYDENTRFTNVLSLFFIATIPASIMVLASLILSYIYMPLAALMLVTAFISWIVIGFIATQESIKADINKVFWIYFIVIALVIAASSIIVKATAEQMINSFISSLSFLDLF